MAAAVACNVGLLVYFKLSNAFDASFLLPVGIKAVQGDFVRGDVVGCLAPDGTEIARGLVNYDSAQLRLIAGRHCDDFAAILGFSGPEEAVHRDNMVMLVSKENKQR